MAKQRRKKRITTVRMGESPTKERRRQNGGVVSEIIDRDAEGNALLRRYRALWECPLDAYRDQKVINEPEHKAGLKFRSAYFQGVLCKRATYERLNQNGPVKPPSHSERVLKDAYETLPSHNKGVIIDVCGHDQLAASETALEKLRKGLGHLAVRWNIAAIEIAEHKPK